MSNFVGQRHVRNGRWHVLAIVEQRHDAGVERLERSSVVLGDKNENKINFKSIFTWQRFGRKEKNCKSSGKKFRRDLEARLLRDHGVLVSCQMSLGGLANAVSAWKSWRLFAVHSPSGRMPRANPSGIVTFRF